MVTLADCRKCKFENVLSYEYPCLICLSGLGYSCFVEKTTLSDYLAGKKKEENAMKNEPIHNGNDAVNHPSHYTAGEIEVINYIRDKLGCEEFTGYCIGNVMKYISRWRHKDGRQDLEKAKVYLQWAIESAQREAERR